MTHPHEANIARGCTCLCDTAKCENLVEKYVASGCHIEDVNNCTVRDIWVCSNFKLQSQAATDEGLATCWNETQEEALPLRKGTLLSPKWDSIAGRVRLMANHFG